MKSVQSYFLLPALLLAVAATSCRFEEDDIFEDSAAIRIEKFNDDVQSVLCAADSGWVMQFFTLSETRGYNFYCRFYDDGQVTIGGSHAYLPTPNVYAEYNSLYELTREDGPVLSFNTWNDILSVFASPEYANPATGREAEGMGGDYNYLVLSASADEVRLRGQRHSAAVRLIPCPMSWADYRAASEALASRFFNSRIQYFYMVSGTDTLYASGMTGGVLTIVDDIADPTSSENAPFVPTLTGIRLENAFSLGGHSTAEYFLNADSTAFLSADGVMAFAPGWQIFTDTLLMDTLTVTNLKANYNKRGLKVWWQPLITGEGACEAFQTAYEEMATALKGLNVSYTLIGLTICTSDDERPKAGVTLYTTKLQKRKPKDIYAAFTSNFVRNGDEVTFEIDLEDWSYNADYFARYPETMEKIKTVLSFIQGTFIVSPDNGFYPTKLLFTSKTDPSIFFTAQINENSVVGSGGSGGGLWGN